VAVAVAGLAALAACRRGAPEAVTPAPVVAPAAAADTPATPPIDRSRPPTLGAPPPVVVPPVVRRELPNGMRLLIVEHHELPLADFVLVVGTGGEANPGSRAGLASLVADMLDEGTATRSALQIADQAAFLGVDLGAASTWDASLVQLHTSTAQLDSALALFADVALRPAFAARELERLRRERLTELVQLADRPREIADRAYASLVFGGEHPYGRPLVGTARTVRAITRAEVQRFHRTYYRPNNATLIVVGDVTPDDVERRVRALFGAWERATVPETRYPEPPASRTTTVYLIDKPGAPQSSVRIGGVGVARSTQDYFALQVMNTILGGSFTSRLNQNLRETHGYTYGASSRFDMRRTAGPFTARAEVTGTQTDSALVEFLKELRAIRDTVPASELERAKRYLQLQLPGDFETTGDIASQLVPIVLYDLPLDYYNSVVQRIEGVSQSDVQRVAERYVDPARLAVVIVGDRESIESGLRALDVGDVTIRDLTGMPVRR
jgi:predicted Zn-dependent peptidase